MSRIEKLDKMELALSRMARLVNASGTNEIVQPLLTIVFARVAACRVAADEVAATRETNFMFDALGLEER